jgi:hypothetical protein
MTTDVKQTTNSLTGPGLLYRECPPWNKCPPRQRCRHLSCYDPDWLEDMEDYCFNAEANDELWEAFFYAAYRATIPSAKLAEHERKFDRCQRITDKQTEIDAEIFYRQAMWMKKRGAKVDAELADCHADIQAHEKKLGKRFAWYERDTEVSGYRPVSLNVELTC